MKVVNRNDSNKCAIKGCRDTSTIIYLNTPLCEKHWSILAEKSCEETKKILGINEHKRT